MRTLSKTIVYFDALNDDAKEKAREWFREGNDMPDLEDLEPRTARSGSPAGTERASPRPARHGPTVTSREENIHISTCIPPPSESTPIYTLFIKK